MNVKASIEYVCWIVQALGICNGELSPEILRKAKFNHNHPSVSSLLLRTLHDLVILNLAAFPPFPPHRHEQNLNHHKNNSCSDSEGRMQHKIVGRVQKTPCKLQRNNKNKKQQDVESSKNPKSTKPKGKLQTKCAAGKVKIGIRKEKNIKCRCAREILEELWQRFGKHCPDKAIAFVKFYLGLWGYPPHSPFFALSAQTQQTRQLLLAFGWLISHCEIFQRGAEMRIRPLIAIRNRAPLPPYPIDVSFSEEAAQIACVAESGAREYVKRVMDTSNRISDPQERSSARAHQVLMLYGRVQTTLKSLYALESCKAMRIHELNQLQLEMGVRNKDGRPYTQYEVHLLQNREVCLKHSQAAKADGQIAIELEENRKHSKIFWEWMESVVEEALNEEQKLRNPANLKNLEDNGDGGEEEEILSIEVLQPVIEFLQKQLLQMKEANVSELQDFSRVEETEKGTEEEEDTNVQVLPDSIVNALAQILIQNGANKVESPTTSTDVGNKQYEGYRSSGRDQKCKLRSLLSDLSLLQPLFVRETKNKRQGKKPNPIFGGHATAEKTIQSLKDIAVDLTRILARTRAQNRAVIQKALKPIIEDENFVLVGV
eukprot:Gb_12038 [translate_table: standard]